MDRAYSLAEMQAQAQADDALLERLAREHFDYDNWA